MDIPERVVIVGSLGFDHIMGLNARIDDYIMVESLDKLNVSFTVDTLRKEFGGTAGNCAYALGQFGYKPVLVSAWGKDAEAYMDHLIAVGVDTGYVKLVEDTFSAWGHVMTDTQGKQLWMYYPGALRHMSEMSMAQIVQPGDLVLLMPSEPVAYVKHLEEMIQIGARYLFDPAFFVPTLTAEMLQKGIEHALIVIANEYEIELMERKTDSALTDWLSGDKVVIRTMGERGAEVYQGNQVWRIDPAKPVRVADPTGAGDAFRAGLVAGMLKGLPLLTCGRMGALVATCGVEVDGTQTYEIDQTAFVERYMQTYGEALVL